MKAIVLAAGYATRLYPLTQTVAKPLLPVGGRPMIDWILDGIHTVDAVDEVHVVTNHKFAAAFAGWAAGAATDVPVRVHDDGTTSEDDRLGAIGDIRFVLDDGAIDDDLFVIAGDNLLGFDLGDYVAFWHSKGVASAVAVRDVGSLELARRYGIVALAEDGRLEAFLEKPADPPSTLAATAAYIYHRAHVPLIRTYLDEGNPPDQPGNFVGWLHQREPVYAYVFTGEWRDIGDHEQLLAADNELRERAGLPARTAYSLD
jgi:glucose-1-phosphate thymidylyltransferase